VDRALDARQSADGVVAPNVRRATVPAQVLAAPGRHQRRSFRSAQVWCAARDDTDDGADLQLQTARGDDTTWQENWRKKAKETAATAAGGGERRL